MNNRYDIAIIGSGPAGLSAALNAKIRNKSFILFGSPALSSKIEKAPKINNYLGFPSYTGKELAQSFTNHINDLDIKITEERVNNIFSMGDYFTMMVNDKAYEATSVIIASGVQFGRPIVGEEKFLGRGVGYCATCDAPLYKGKIVTIVAYNEEGEDEANYVSELASKVYFVPMYKSEYKLNQNIEIVNDTPVEIVGQMKAEKLVIKNGEIITDGIFLLKDAISPAQLVPGLQMEDGHVKVDRLMTTNLKGCFACGDCVGRPYQYIKSAGEGNIASLSAVAYVDKK